MSRHVPLAILIVLLCCSVAALAADISVGGSIYAEVMYTPKELLTIGDRVRMNAYVRGSNYSVTLGGVWHDVVPLWKSNRVGNLANFESSRLDLKIPSFLSLEPLVVTIGSAPINGYPEFAARIDNKSNTAGWPGGLRRTLQIDKLTYRLTMGGAQILDVSGRGFVVWERDKPDAFGRGIAVDLGYGDWDTRLTMVDYRELERLLIDGTPGYYGAPLETDTVYGIEVSGPLAGRLAFDYTGAWHRAGVRDDVDETKVNIKTHRLLDMSFRYELSEDAAVVLGYKDYEPEFDPKYRNRDPEGNLIDNEYDRRGVHAALIATLSPIPVNVELTAAQYNSHAAKPTVSHLLGAKANFALFGVDAELEYSTELIAPPAAPLSQEHEAKIEVAYSVRQGLFKGVRVDGKLSDQVVEGKRSRESSVGITYEFSWGSKLEARYYSPNIDSSFVRLSHEVKL